MPNIAVINATRLDDPVFRPLRGGESSFQRTIEFSRRLPDVDETVLLLSRPLPAPRGCRQVLRKSWSVADLLTELEKAAEEREDIFYFFADCPFLDRDIAARMHANHRKYWADYTYADGYPYGLAPEILRRDTVARLRALSGDGKGAPDRETLFTLVKKDINSFDIETEISPKDMRLLRVSLCADTERNFLLLSRLASKSATDAASVCRLLEEEPESLRTLPAFFPIQIVGQCPHSCSYCPYPVFAGDVVRREERMSVDDFSALLKKISDFTRSAVIDVSLWGDPSLHPRIYDVIAAALREPSLELVIETSGVGWEPRIIPRVRESFERQPTWIVSLDGHAEETHRRLRGVGFSEALRTVDSLLEHFPATTWVQAVRMKENEEELETFYKSWKKRTDNVIIQKYDSFCGLLPDRKVADLSPRKRFPCWHLKRDFPILLDGTVPLCREDVRATHALGNAFHEELSAIWDRGMEAYRSHLRESYPTICAGCDEYYTFNF